MSDGQPGGPGCICDPELQKFCADVLGREHAGGCPRSSEPVEEVAVDAYTLIKERYPAEEDRALRVALLRIAYAGEHADTELVWLAARVNAFLTSKDVELSATQLAESAEATAGALVQAAAALRKSVPELIQLARQRAPEVSDDGVHGNAPGSATPDRWDGQF